MNILIYVITLLMILATMTYAKLEMFRSMVGFQSMYSELMIKREHQDISALGLEMYQKIRMRKNNSGKKPASAVQANPRINFHLLLNKKARENKQEAYYQTRALMKQLIKTLGKDNKKLEEKLALRSTMIDDLLDEIESGAEALPKKVKITEPDGLTKLEFSDSSLKETFYLILNGSPILVPPKTKEEPTSSNQNRLQDEEEEENDDEATEEEESAESNAPTGMESILNYVTIDKSKHTVRIYLAKPPVLMAIFDNENLVKDVMEMRSKLYREVRKKNGKKDPAAATAEFKAAFESYAAPYKDIVDFSVTNTNPNR